MVLLIVQVKPISTAVILPHKLYEQARQYQPSCFYIHASMVLLLAYYQSRPQSPPSHEEERSGKPSQISWARRRAGWARD